MLSVGSIYQKKMNFRTPFETLPKSLSSLKLNKPSPKSKKNQPSTPSQLPGESISKPNCEDTYLLKIPNSKPINPTLFHNSDGVPFLKCLISTWPFSVTSEVITKAGAGVSHLKTLKWFYGNFFVWFRNIFLKISIINYQTII